MTLAIFLHWEFLIKNMNHDLRPIIDFWDMSHTLMNPISSISLETKNEAGSDTVNSKLYATTARFDINGNNIIIGFNNGSILI